MTDKQRLDAYVQAAMVGFYANPLIATETHQPEQLMKFIFEGGKGMMDYVDVQEVKAEPREGAGGWILNTGSLPVAYETDVDLIFSDGATRPCSTAGHYLWDIEVGDEYHITHWRKAQ